MKIYISFGQIHVHSINGKTFDKNCLAAIECQSRKDGLDKAFEYFRDKFSNYYSEEEAKSSLEYYPRGIINVNS